jgi:hypothetical protein
MLPKALKLKLLNQADKPPKLGFAGKVTPKSSLRANPL